MSNAFILHVNYYSIADNKSGVSILVTLQASITSVRRETEEFSPEVPIIILMSITQ